LTAVRREVLVIRILAVERTMAALGGFYKAINGPRDLAGLKWYLIR
jgi:hypothetical protein